MTDTTAALPSINKEATVSASKPSDESKYYTLAEVALHNIASDCWVSLFGRVLDLTPLLTEQNQVSERAIPIIKAAGTDVSGWFEEATREPRSFIDVATGLPTPLHQVLHTLPVEPRSDLTVPAIPWWNDEKYCVGLLSKQGMQLKMVNTFTSKTTKFSCCAEERLVEIQERFLEWNAHARSYTWKAILDGSIVPLDMSLTLEANGIDLPTADLDEEDLMPTILLYFNDDLTTA
jgi:hypothetical protein